MSDKPKILGRAHTPIPPDVARKFLHSIGIWDFLSKQDLDAFIMRSEILETRGGNALALKIGEIGADAYLINKLDKETAP